MASKARTIGKYWPHRNQGTAVEGKRTILLHSTREQEIRNRAYGDLSAARSTTRAMEVEDWLQAERELNA